MRWVSCNGQLYIRAMVDPTILVACDTRSHFDIKSMGHFGTKFSNLGSFLLLLSPLPVRENIS